VSAYRNRALCSGGRCKVRYLAAGFFTKLLYFGGCGTKPRLGRPLIYDSRVVAALNKWTDGTCAVEAFQCIRCNAFDVDAR
jgi:hypothetical protein